MYFDSVYCISDIIIIQSHDNYFKGRMNGTRVSVINSEEKSESFCGTLNTDLSNSFRVSCDMKCGDEVEIKVRHEPGHDFGGCIHMKEIAAFGDGRINYEFFGVLLLH
jgi:hypothetical protein